MSTIVAQPTTATKNKIVPPSAKELKKMLKNNLELYKRVSDGLPILPMDDKYLSATKELSNEILSRLDVLLTKYEELYESTENKRVATIKPRYCDKKLTTFLSQHFKRYLPDNGHYGILDLNRIAPRAISRYVKEKGLGETQFFSLDEPLKQLFESPSVEDPSKTYLQLAHDRINEIRSAKDYKTSQSSADIFTDGNNTMMNYSALKIIIPKFGVKYDITDPDMYIQQLEEFNAHLELLHNQYEEMKKKRKKAE